MALPVEGVPGLTPRQREVLDLIARGYTNAAIANSLVLTEKSVENHITAIYQQLGIDLRDAELNPRVTAALLYLRHQNITPLEAWRRRYRPAGSDELDDSELAHAVGGVGGEQQLVDLIRRAGL